jgi:predicted nucleic acid-binding protein
VDGGQGGDSHLDACCLNRPFDDQKQNRIRLEAEAVLLILSRVEQGEWQWVSSDVTTYEIQQTPDVERRRRTLALAQLASRVVQVDRTIEHRGVELAKKGFGSYHALHLAAAEDAGVDAFLTTDDRLLRLARRMAHDLHVPVDNRLRGFRKSVNYEFAADDDTR